MEGRGILDGMRLGRGGEFPLFQNWPLIWLCLQLPYAQICYLFNGTTQKNPESPMTLPSPSLLMFNLLPTPMAFPSEQAPLHFPLYWHLPSPNTYPCADFCHILFVGLPTSIFTPANLFSPEVRMISSSCKSHHIAHSFYCSLFKTFHLSLNKDSIPYHVLIGISSSGSY